MLLWILESREHAAFRNTWRTWAREELGESPEYSEADKPSRICSVGNGS
jgi:hypothetical protein